MSEQTFVAILAWVVIVLSVITFMVGLGLLDKGKFKPTISVERITNFTQLKVDDYLIDDTGGRMRVVGRVSDSLILVWVGGQYSTAKLGNITYAYRVPGEKPVVSEASTKAYSSPQYNTGELAK